MDKVQSEILSFTKLATATALNIKINEVKNKIPSIADSATNASLNAKKIRLKVKNLILLT